MNKRFLSIAALLSVGSAAWGVVSPIEPTRPFRYGTMSYPMHREAAEDMEDFCLDFDVFAGGYHSQANKAFSSDHGAGDSNEVPVARLLFGKDKFTLGDSFAGGGADQDALRKTNNPFINATTLAPGYDFEENGAMFRASINTSWGCWRMGLRGSLPFRSIDIKEICSGDVNGVNLEGTTKKSDLYQTRLEENRFDPNTILVRDSAGNFVPNSEVEPRTNEVYAARLDFLSSLNRIGYGANGQQDADPLVNYNPQNGSIRIADVRVDGQDAAGSNNNEPYVAVIQRNDGSLPIDQRWGALNTAINGRTVAGDGSGLLNNQRGRFNDPVNYSPLSNDTAAQSDLWVVPTLSKNNPDGSNGSGSVTKRARQIQAAITQSLQAADDSVEDFINRADLDFCDGRTQGAGDLDFELYFGYDWTECADLWSEFSLGIRVPTGEEVEDCSNVLKQPAGLDDHVGIRLGSAHGWDAFDWLKLNLALRYTFVLENTQQVAAPFEGATIRGIGPCVSAETEWGYLEGYFNATVPVNDCCGFDIGYQVYHQPDLDRDDIRLHRYTATDLAGRQNQPLDKNILTRDTDRTSHKIHTAFHMSYENCALHMGFSHAFAGQNILRETDWYAGIHVDY